MTKQYAHLLSVEVQENITRGLYDAEKVKGLTRFSLYFCINVGSFFINSSGFLNMYTTQYHQFDVFVHQSGQEDHIHRKNCQKVEEKSCLWLDFELQICWHLLCKCESRINDSWGCIDASNLRSQGWTLWNHVILA